MGLQADLMEVIKVSMGCPELTLEQTKSLKQTTQMQAKAIIDFLLKQTWTITELKAMVELEEIKTAAPIQADVLPSVTTTVAPGIGVATSGGGGATVAPGTGVVSMGTKGVLIHPINYMKTGGQGGAMIAIGHAYVGKPAAKVPKQDTSLEKNKFTKVRLHKEFLVAM